MLRRTLCLLIPTLLSLGVLVGFANSPTAAQRDRPPATPNPAVEALVERYGTRYAVGALAPPVPGEHSSELRITHAGWLTSTVVVLELGARPQPGCEAGPPAVIGATCLGTVGPLQTLSHVPSPEAERLLVYSLRTAGEDERCARLGELLDGSLGLPQWEEEVWRAAPGARLSVALMGATEQAASAIAPAPAAGFGELAGRGIPAAVRNLRIPWMPDGGRVRVQNAESTCQRGIWRWAAADRAGEPCPTPRQGELDLPPLGMWEVGSDGGSMAEDGALAAATRGQLVAVAERLDDEGWLRYGSGPARLPNPQEAGVSAFPMALSPLDEATSELWVTNQHPTRTAQISLLMWDGNLEQLVPFRDEVGLCPGASRSYDLRQIAGEIPPTRPRRGGDRGPGGPPLLSLRLEAVSADGQVFVPVAGTIVHRGRQGVAASSGLNLPLLSQLGAPRRDQIARGYPPFVTVLPDVRIGYGPRRETTVLAIMVVTPNAQAERQAVVELYDDSGTRIAEPINVRMGVGPGGFLDLQDAARRIGERFPDGFRGSALVRGFQNRGALGVVALHRPVSLSDRPVAADGDRVGAYSGLPLPRGVDPSLPTPTPRPTFPAATPTATSSPTAAEPTPAPPRRLLLPYLLRQAGSGAGSGSS